MKAGIQIGEVARCSGVSIDSVRYYERRGLLPRASRSAGGYRLFTAETIEKVLFIKQAQDLGFTLNEITTLVTAGGSGDCAHVHDLLDLKLKEIDIRLRSMQQFRARLKRYLAECEAELKMHPNSDDCPVVGDIAHSEPKLWQQTSSTK